VEWNEGSFLAAKMWGSCKSDLDRFSLLENHCLFYRSISSSSNAAKSFSVNPANGDITVSSSFPGNLTQRCSLSVIATDRGNPPRESRAVVDITISEH